ncbi:MAG: hypothetical protein U1F70_06645 [Candidatus Competibacteraceae bacterium]
MKRIVARHAIALRVVVLGLCLVQQTGLGPLASRNADPFGFSR